MEKFKEIQEKQKNYCNKLIEVSVKEDERMKQDLAIEVCEFIKDIRKNENLSEEEKIALKRELIRHLKLL